MADEDLELNDDTETFQKGDRVVVSVQRRRRHGHIVAVGSQTCAIHFDTGNGSAKFQTVLVSPSRIKREQSSGTDSESSNSNIPLCCTIQNRATVTNGALTHGSPIHDGFSSTIYNAAAMNGIMHLIRWMVASNSYRSVNTKSNEAEQIRTFSNFTLQQIQQLSSDDCHMWNEIAIQNWEKRVEEPKDDSDTSTHKTPQSDDSSTVGVHGLLVQYFQNQNIASGFIFEALSDIRALRSWQRCLQNDFWCVGKDDTGIYVIPDCRSHEHVVYKVVGFGGGPVAAVSSASSNLGLNSNHNNSTVRAPVRLIRIPMCLRMTILPWYGRLLHDTSVPLPRQKEAIRMATDQVTANRLHTVVLHAIQNGNVIEHFAELETM